MKMVITGHTRGLGKTLFERFSADNEVTGLSRENGYDLSDNLSPFIIDNFDVYINNAYSGYAQVELLYRLFHMNKYRECSIINIGSVSADGNKDVINEYAVHKAALEKACSQLQLIDTDCKVIHLKLGRMNTQMTDHKRDYPRLDTDYIFDSIDWILNQPKNILIKNLTIDMMHSRRKEK
jgi:NADP-dependent 3-hydroxy acid dehydrogenase YdfG